MATAAVEQSNDERRALHTFSVEQYMALDIPERTELLGGLIYDLSPKNAPHSNLLGKLTEALVPPLLGTPLQPRFEQPVAVSGWTGPNAPEIDVAVVARRTYVQPPTAADATAFIEVSDTTYARDRNVKIPLYVQAGVPSWIVNLSLKHVEYYANADDLGRPHGNVFREGDTFTVAGVTIAVEELFAADEPHGDG